MSSIRVADPVLGGEEIVHVKKSVHHVILSIASPSSSPPSEMADQWLGFVSVSVKPFDQAI